MINSGFGRGDGIPSDLRHIINLIKHSEKLTLKRFKPIYPCPGLSLEAKRVIQYEGIQRYVLARAN